MRARPGGSPTTQQRHGSARQIARLACSTAWLSVRLAGWDKVSDTFTEFRAFTPYRCTGKAQSSLP